MAKGYQKNQERLAILSSYGRSLARRSSAKCELCAASGVKLTVFQVPPITDEPELEECIHICQLCQTQINNPKKLDPNHWRCLYESMWSEFPAVQVMAVRLLKELALKERWALELLDDVYLDEETQAWVEKESL